MCARVHVSVPVCAKRSQGGPSSKIIWRCLDLPRERAQKMSRNTIKVCGPSALGPTVSSSTASTAQSEGVWTHWGSARKKCPEILSTFVAPLRWDLLCQGGTAGIAESRATTWNAVVHVPCTALLPYTLDRVPREFAMRVTTYRVARFDRVSAYRCDLPFRHFAKS